MPLPLHEIRISAGSQNLINRANSLSHSLGHAFNEAAQDAMTLAAEYGVDVAKSVVPVDTEELRDKMIVQGNRYQWGVDVFVTDDIHTGRGRPQAASQLADILQSGINETGHRMMRTRNSIPAVVGAVSIGKGSPTKNWINVSNRVFKANINRYISTNTQYKVYI